MIPAKTFNLVAQSAHFFSGVAVVLTGALWHHELGVFAAWVAFSGVKEAIVDPRVETVEVQGSGWLDFGVSALGGVVGLVLLRMVA